MFISDVDIISMIIFYDFRDNLPPTKIKMLLKLEKHFKSILFIV